MTDGGQGLIVGPDPTWPRRFEAARDDLAIALESSARRVEHIGSTAVPGLVAKPVIDVLVVVDATSAVLERSDDLVAIGFAYVANAWPDPTQHLFFRRVVGGRTTHHLHVVPTGSPEIEDYLLLRAYLRSHPDEVAAYGAHKYELVERSAGDREVYVAAKPAYVEELLVRAKTSHDRQGRPGREVAVLDRASGRRLEVRHGRPGDELAIGQIAVDAWRWAYVGIIDAGYLTQLDPAERASRWVDTLWFAPGRSSVLIAELDGDIVGFAATGPSGESGVGELFALNLDPGATRVGIGSALLAAAEQELAAHGFDRAVLWVLPGNQRARSFYEARGWNSDHVERVELVLDIELDEVRYSRTLHDEGGR